MADVVLFLTGTQIGTYGAVSSSGNSNGVQVRLTDVQPLGAETDLFRVVVRQVNGGQSAFGNGQFVDITAWPDGSTPLYANLNPQHDQFQGRASSSGHQIFTSPARIVFDLAGVTSGTMQYGPGLVPLRSEQLPFDAFPGEPPAFCFAAGTLIETGAGPRPVEDLRPGDLVQTRDHGLQPVRWCGARQVAGTGRLAPVSFAPGVMRNWRWLHVSPQHRMLVDGWRAEVMFGAPEVLVPARALVNGRTIRRAPRARVTWHHLLLDRHEILLAEGAASESLLLGPVALGTLDAAARAELGALFPDVLLRRRSMRPARPLVAPREAAVLAVQPAISTGVLSPAA